MTNPAPRAEVAAALDEALDAFAALVRKLIEVDGADAAIVPGMTWTVADVVAHVTTLHRRAIDDRRRSATPAETAELNGRCLDEQPSRDLAELLTWIQRDGPVAHAGLRQLPGDVVFPFHAGSRTTVGPVSGVVLAEYLVHADDIRRAVGEAGRPDPGHARLAILATLPLLGSWGLPGEAVDVAVRLAGTGDVVSYRLGAHGLQAVNEPCAATEPVEVDPADWLLAFPFARRPLPAGTDALTGRLAPI